MEKHKKYDLRIKLLEDSLEEIMIYYENLAHPFKPNNKTYKIAEKALERSRK